jgi:hypothetical protein
MPELWLEDCPFGLFRPEFTIPGTLARGVVSCLPPVSLRAVLPRPGTFARGVVSGLPPVSFGKAERDGGRTLGIETPIQP